MLLIAWNIDENMKHKNNEKHKTIRIVCYIFYDFNVLAAHWSPYIWRR